MHIEIQARDFSLTPAIREYTRRKLACALGTRFEHIKSIMVRLLDINGPRGGNDKRCQIQITIPRLRNIVIEDTESDLYLAISRAADRASRTVTRKLARQSHQNRRLNSPDKRNIDSLKDAASLA